MHLTLIPSYGRDYKTAKEVKAAWEAGKDFTICTFGHPHDGRQINKQDATKGMVLNIRYKGKTEVVVIKVK